MHVFLLFKLQILALEFSLVCNFCFGSLDTGLVIAELTAGQLEILEKFASFGVFQLFHRGAFEVVGTIFHNADRNTVTLHFFLDLLGNRCRLCKICIENFIVRGKFFRAVIGPVDICSGGLTDDVSSVFRCTLVSLGSLIIVEI